MRILKYNFNSNNISKTSNNIILINNYIYTRRLIKTTILLKILLDLLEIKIIIAIVKKVIN